MVYASDLLIAAPDGLASQLINGIRDRLAQPQSGRCRCLWTKILNQMVSIDENKNRSGISCGAHGKASDQRSKEGVEVGWPSDHVLAYVCRHGDLQAPSMKDGACNSPDPLRCLVWPMGLERDNRTW